MINGDVLKRKTPPMLDFLLEAKQAGFKQARIVLTKKKALAMAFCLVPAFDFDMVEIAEGVVCFVVELNHKELLTTEGTEV